MICVVLPFATFGLIVEDGIIVIAPPIGRWALGKTALNVWRYYSGRRDARLLWLP